MAAGDLQNQKHIGSNIKTDAQHGVVGLQAITAVGEKTIAVAAWIAVQDQADLVGVGGERGSESGKQ